MSKPITDILQSMPWTAVSSATAVELVTALCAILSDAERSELTGPAHEALVTAAASLRERVQRKAIDLNNREGFGRGTSRQMCRTQLSGVLQALTKQRRT